MPNNMISMNDVAKQMSGIANTMNAMATSITSMADTVSKLTESHVEMKNEVNVIKGEVNFLKEDTNISEEEKESIKSAASSRVCELLGVPVMKKNRTQDDKIRYQKYNKAFYCRLYGELKRRGHLASKIGNTRKGDYETVLKEIEYWVPIGGVKRLIIEADQDAEAMLIAKAKGYK